MYPPILVLLGDSIQVETRVEIGDANQSIIDTAVQARADLIAMATDRWSDVDRWLNDGVADWLLHSEIVLLRAVRDSNYATFAEAQAYLDGVGARQPCAPASTISRVIVAAPDKAIQEVVESVGCDLIALCTNGRVGLSRLLHGSVATKMLQRASVPVLIVPAVGTVGGARQGAVARI